MKHLARLTILGIAFIGNSVLALPDDRSKPIEIQADSAERDAKTGVTTYSGNVDVQQGSIHIVASKVVLNSANDKLTKIHAIGSPATYHQQLTGPSDVVDAQALNIYFDADKRSLIETPHLYVLHLNDDKKGETPWEVTADKATAYQTSSIIDLYGNVTLFSNATLGGPTRIMSEYLHVNTERKLAHTDKAVTIHARNSVSQAVGMQADLEHDYLQLPSRVKEIHEAPR